MPKGELSLRHELDALEDLLYAYVTQNSIGFTTWKQYNSDSASVLAMMKVMLVGTTDLVDEYQQF